MSVFEFDVSESVAFYDNEVQGNKFNGLEFDDVLTEGLFFDELFQLSSFEILDDVLSFDESFSNDHHCIVTSTASFVDSYIPSASLQFATVQIAHRQKVSPVDIYWVSMDVVHGPDVFYEELGETFFLYSGSIVANFFLEPIFDSFFMDMDPPYQTFVDVARVMYLKSTDLYVMQNNTVPEYRLNNLCEESLFVFPHPTRGFSHVVKSQLRPSDAIVFAHARTVETALVAVATCGTTWRGQETISEAFVSFDTTQDEKYYEHLLAESVAFVEENGLAPVVSEIVSSGLKAVDTHDASLVVYFDLVESLVSSFVAQLTYQVTEEFDDGFSLGSEALTNHLIKDILLDTVDVLHEAFPSIRLMEALVDSLIQHSESGVES